MVLLHLEGIVCWFWWQGWSYGFHLCWHDSRIAYMICQGQFELWIHAFQSDIHLEALEALLNGANATLISEICLTSIVVVCCVCWNGRWQKGKRETPARQQQGCRHKTDSLKFDVFLLGGYRRRTTLSFSLVIHLLRYVMVNNTRSKNNIYWHYLFRHATKESR